MDFQTESAKIKELVSNANDILIVTHEHPTFDSIGSSLALYLGLTSLGKKVAIACPDPITVELSSFVGVNKIVAEAGKKNFVISLDYVEGSIEKVSYNIAGNTFNLVIEPRAGFPMFSEDKVHYSHAGASGDLIFAVDTIHLGGLKKLYEEDKDLYATKPLVNIDRHPNNVHFGQINYIDNQASSTAELIGQVLAALGASMTEDIATNLLNALYGGTNNFQSPSITASAFGLAASCVKAGGKRFRGRESAQAPAPTGMDIPQVMKVSEAPNAAKDQAAQPHGPQGTPADWLKPKIFKSSNPFSDQGKPL